MKPIPSQREGLLASLIAARKRARVSRAKVARRAGVTRMTLGRLENGGQVPSPRILRAYAETCGLDANQLLLSWGIVPEEVLLRLQQHPHLLALVLNS